MVQRREKSHMQSVDDRAKVLYCVLALHRLQHAIASGLHGDVQEAKDVGLAEEGGNVIEVLENVGRIGHSEADHGAVAAMSVHESGYGFKEVRDVEGVCGID